MALGRVIVQEEQVYFFESFEELFNDIDNAEALPNATSAMNAVPSQDIVTSQRNTASLRIACVGVEQGTAEHLR